MLRETAYVQSGRSAPMANSDACRASALTKTVHASSSQFRRLVFWPQHGSACAAAIYQGLRRLRKIGATSCANGLVIFSFHDRDTAQKEVSESRVECHSRHSEEQVECLNPRTWSECYMVVGEPTVRSKLRHSALWILVSSGNNSRYAGIPVYSPPR